MTDLADVPPHELISGDALFRIHRSSNSPEHFGISGDNRFDPPPHRATDFGTCYLALEPLAAYVEVFGSLEEVYVDTLAERVLSSAIVDGDLRLFDLTDRAVLGNFGITAALSTVPDYTEPQEWASRFFDAGFHGVRYRTSHDPAMELEAVALFRNRRLSHQAAPALKWNDPHPISAALQRQGEQFGIFVRPRP